MNDWHDAEQHVERAHDLYELGRMAEAEAELREALLRNPYQSQWHFNLGLTLEASQRWREAIEAFTQSHELDEADGNAALMIGYCQLRMDRPRLAIQWLEQAEKGQTHRVASYIGRIEAYAALGDHEQAEVMFYMAQQTDPQESQAFVCMAESLLDQGQFERAVSCLREAASLDPSLPGLQSRLAEAYASTGRLERARQLYMRELRQHPGDVRTLLDVGLLLVDMRRHDEAGEKFRRVLELEPDNADAHFALGELALRCDDRDEALTRFDIVLRLDETVPGVRRRVAELLLTRHKQGDLPRARELLNDDVDHAQQCDHRHNRDQDPKALRDLGRLLIEASMYQRAAKVFKKLIDIESDDADAWHQLAVSQFMLEQVQAGMDASRQAIRLNPGNVAAIHNLALALVQQQQWARARYWVRRAVRVDSDDASLRRLRLNLRLRSVGEWFARRIKKLKARMSRKH